MSTNNKDEVFAQIVQEMLNLVISTASSCSQEVLRISASYLDRSAQKTVEDFHKLYFSKSKSIIANKEAMNRDVDSLFDQAKEAIAKGGDYDLKSSKEAEEIRLGLSAVQKELEALITMENGIKEQLAPVLSCMQFEDALRQRLEHIAFGWKEIFAKKCDEKTIDIEAIKNILSSVSETEAFYRRALKEEPPKDMGEKESSVLFF